MMSKFIKSIGKGILYIFAFPLLIILVSLFAIVGIFIFIYLLFKSVVLFFKGKTIFSDLPEDVEARKILNTNSNPIISDIEEKKEENESPLSLYPSDSNMYKSEYSNFEQEKEETPVPSATEVNDIEEKIEETEIKIEEKKEEEIIGRFTPLNSGNEDENK